MPVITLTSDWNSADYYIAAVKGQLLSLQEGLRIVDICHQIKAFNTGQAAFVLRNAWPHFPPGTIHLIFVNAEATAGEAHILAVAGGQYFIGADNGLLSLVLGNKADKVIKLNMEAGDAFPGFPGLQLFTRTASVLASGTAPESLGETMPGLKERIPLRATIEGKVITGSIIYIDSYQNAITNISRELFERIGAGKPFELFVQSKHYRITRICKTYTEESPGELLALFNSANLLEIAIRNGNAARLLNLDTNSTVRVEFT